MPALSASHAPQYLRLASLLVKHRQAAGLHLGQGPDTEQATKDAEELVSELEAMGPTFVKLGQLLSTRSDFLPPEYIAALSRLRDDVAPMDVGRAEAVIEAELGVRISQGFSSFESQPIGSASLGQVHRAALRDGRPVAVKVQRDGAEEQVAGDIEVISELAEWLDDHSSAVRRFGIRPMVDRFNKSLAAELDYQKEAANLRLVAEQLTDYQHIVIPQPVPDYCSRRVLTMDYVAGRNVGSLGALALLDLDGSVLADELFRAYLDQVLVHGLFNTDPHPGNLLITDDRRLAILDFGQMATLAPDTQEQLLRLLLALAEGNPPRVSEALQHLGEPLEDYDSASLEAGVSEIVLQLKGSAVGELQIGQTLGDIARVAVDSGLRPPTELTLVAKAMLDLDQTARRLDPSFVPEEAVRSHAAHLMRHRMLQAVSPGRLMAGALDAREFMDRLPARLNKVLDSLAEGDFTLNIEGLDEPELMRGVQKLANRAATGLVIAALLLSSAIFATAKVGPSAGGFPVVTLVFLGLAFVASIWLGFGILRSDLPQRPHRRRKPSP